MRKLNQKQSRFVDEYLIDLNATQAAIRAGYSKKTAGQIGEKLLKKAEIQNIISERIRLRAKRTEITQDLVLNELAKIAFGDIRALFDGDGNLISIPSLPAEAAAMLSGFDATVSGGEKPEITKKVKLNDRIRALELIGRHLKMFTDKVEHSGEDGEPISLNIILNK